MLRTLGTLLVLSTFAVGCDVGQVPGTAGDDGTGGPDARIGGGGPDASLDTPVCKPTVNGVGSGNHNPGQQCMQAGACHAIGGGGPQWTVAGTLYTDALGAAPNIGATITIKDANGLEVNVASQQNGNFYTPATLVPPFKVYASECPGIMSMTATAAGDCNSAGCHALGSTQGAVYLP